MKTIWKIITISVVCGFVLSVLGVAFGASQSIYLDKTGVHIVTYDETRITEPDLGSFKNIEIDVAYSDVEFVSADKYGIEIYSDDGDWDWSLNGETLKIAQNQKSGGRINIMNFNLDMNRRSSLVTVYLPQGVELGSVSVKTDSGDTDIGDFNADDVQIDSSYGKVNFYSVTSDNMQIDMSSGDFTGTELNAQNIDYKNSYGKGLFDRITAQKIAIDSDSGDLTLTDCKVGDIGIDNSYGEIRADKLFSSKTDIHSSSGDITLTGEFSGETTIRSSYGKINLSTSRERAYYSYDISTDYGKIVFDDEKLGNNTKLKSDNQSENILKIEANSGDVEVRFMK